MFLHTIDIVLYMRFRDFTGCSAETAKLVNFFTPILNHNQVYIYTHTKTMQILLITSKKIIKNCNKVLKFKCLSYTKSIIDDVNDLKSNPKL